MVGGTNVVVVAVVVGATVVVGAVVVVVALAQPVGHCHTPFASASQLQSPSHCTSPESLGFSVVVVVVEVESSTSGRSLFQVPSLCW